MCLSTLDKKPRRKWGFGWKSGYVGERSFTTWCQNSILPMGKWVKDESVEQIVNGSKGFSYQTGFHIYAEKDAAVADGNDCVRVQFRKVVATGTWSGDRVIVAREIKIFPPKK